MTVGVDVQRLVDDPWLNKSRAIDLMATHGLDAIVATTLENVTYLTGHVGWVQRVYRERQNIAVLSADGSIDLVINGGDITYYASQGGHADTVRSYGGKSALIIAEGHPAPTAEEQIWLELRETSAEAPSAGAAFAAVMAERGLLSGRIVVDQVPGSPVYDAIAAALPGCELLPGASFFLMVRLVKTESELAVLRAAAQINEDAIAEMLASLRPGTTELEAAEIWRSSVAGSGAMWHWFHFGSGSRSIFNFPPTDRALAAGDLFMFDCGLFYRNYNADTGGCGSVGAPAAIDLERFRAVEQGVDAAVEVVREGVTGSTVYRVMCDAIRQAGLHEFNAPFAGHTIGLEAREVPFTLADETPYSDPFLPLTSELPLPAGAVINIEAPIGVLGHGGYQVEKSVVVRPVGYELLLDQSRTFHIVEEVALRR